MRHRAHELDARLGGGRLRHARRLVRVARAQPPHAGVELDVHAPAAARGHRGDERLAPGDDVGARGQRDVELLGAQRAEDEQRPVDAGARSCAASSAVATASHVAPPASAARAAGAAPWP